MYDLTSDLRVVPNYTPDELDSFLQGTPMHGMGASFARWGNEYGVNPVYVMALGILESGWGRSSFAQQRNNFFGYQAFDSNPDAAASFLSPDGAVQFISCFLANSYLHEPNNRTYALPPTQVGKPNQYSYYGQFYGGSPTLAGVYKKYSTAPHAPYSIMNLMNQFVTHTTQVQGVVGSTAQAVVTSVPLPQEANVQTYVVQAGDSLWKIAANFYHDPYKWVDLAAANAIPGPSYTIHAGDSLKLPGTTGTGNTGKLPDQSVQSQVRTYQTVPGDTLWSIALHFYGDGTKYHQIFDANRDTLSDPNLIYAHTVLRIP